MDRPLSHLRNAAVAFFSVLLIFLLIAQPQPAPVRAQDLDPPSDAETVDSTQSDQALRTASFEFTLTNDTGADRDFNISVDGLPGEYTIVLAQDTVSLTDGADDSIEVDVIVPVDATTATETGTIRAEAADDATIAVESDITINVIGPAANTPTSTNTPEAAQGTVAFDPTSAEVTITSTNVSARDRTATFEFVLQNNSNSNRTFDITDSDLPNDFSVFINPATVTINANSSEEIDIEVTVPENEPVSSVVGRIRARDEDDSSFEAFAQIFINVDGPTRTPTNTPNITETPTPTEGPICEDGFEDNDDLDSARVIDVNTTQQHALCPADDEDWLVFGGVGGKVYTIDVLEMDPGIDLSLELYNEDGERLEFNDDFFDRDPPNPNDLRPRIESWQSPEDGRYYIRVRDAAARGAVDRRYVIGLFGESGGPTPTTVLEVCLDLFEPDGLPEEARLITSNELQEDHRLCPEGDADWVTFFGKAGKRYFIFTETSRYRGEVPVNNETQAGADTVMVLTDRDGVSVIDLNDDIPGGNTLDSQIEFIPTVDGFYYVQIKNIGDIGNQFIRYDLFLQLCVPGQTDCGRPGGSVPDLPRPQPGDPADTPVPTVAATPVEDFTLDGVEFDVALPTPTATPGAGSASTDEDFVALALPEFADPAFQRLWQRYDQSVASRRLERSWTWGPASLMIRSEEYRQNAADVRSVQYFDKARMELNAEDPALVTNGLLVQEMISGQIQVGDNVFVSHRPAAIALAGDSNSPAAPTYASLHHLSNVSFDDRTGRYVEEALRRSGRIGVYDGAQLEAARLAHFVPETGHNIASVFWDFLNQEGEVFEAGQYVDGPLIDWLSTVGYPVTEPYWITARIDGTSQDVLVQAFQRRVLTYNPTNPRDWQIEMGNVGRHYYEWRYGTALP